MIVFTVNKNTSPSTSFIAVLHTFMQWDEAVTRIMNSPKTMYAKLVGEFLSKVKPGYVYSVDILLVTLESISQKDFSHGSQNFFECFFTFAEALDSLREFFGYITETFTCLVCGDQEMKRYCAYDERYFKTNSEAYRKCHCSNPIFYSDTIINPEGKLLFIRSCNLNNPLLKDWKVVMRILLNKNYIPDFMYNKNNPGAELSLSEINIPNVIVYVCKRR